MTEEMPTRLRVADTQRLTSSFGLGTLPPGIKYVSRLWISYADVPQLAYPTIFTLVLTGIHRLSKHAVSVLDNGEAV